MHTTGLKGAMLSLQQDRLWTFQGDSEVYHAQCAVRLQGHLDVERLRHALQWVVGLHEILHTVFYTPPGSDRPIQVINQSIEVPCPLINLEDKDTSIQDSLVASTFNALQFDLEHGPLVRAMVFRLSLQTHLLLLSLPALCADAATLPLLISELGAQYTGLQGIEALAEEPLQYVEVAAWQDTLLESEGAKIPREFWRRVDLSQLARMPLPFVHRREERDRAAFRPETIDIAIEEALSIDIAKFAQRYTVSLDAILLAGWYITLSRLTDEAHLIIGVAANGRPYEELADALGCYTRFLPIDASFERWRTFEQLVNSVNQSLQEAMKWQSYFTWNLEHMPEDGKSGMNYFPVSFEYESWPANISWGTLTLSLVRCVHCNEPFALKLSALCVGERLQLEVHYNAQYVSADSARRLSSVLHTLLRSAVEQPAAPINVLRLLEAGSQKQLLNAFRAPAQERPAQVLHYLFEKQALRTPDQVAVMDTKEELTYHELNRRANQLAAVLRRRGVGPNILVGLCI